MGKQVKKEETTPSRRKLIDEIEKGLPKSKRRKKPFPEPKIKNA